MRHLQCTTSGGGGVNSLTLHLQNTTNALQTIKPRRTNLPSGGLVHVVRRFRGCKALKITLRVFEKRAYPRAATAHVFIAERNVLRLNSVTACLYRRIRSHGT